MNRFRLIITGVISIVLVSILMLGSTYSIFTTTEIDENTNVYTTGNLNVSYNSYYKNIKITNAEPLSIEEANAVIPYHITVSNTGTVPYMFDLILNDTTAGEVIDYQYIMTKVGYLEEKSLSECTGNIIKEDIILPAGEKVDIDVRVWVSDKIKNTEIGKSFYAKLSVDGLAVYDDSNDIDNSVLALNYMKKLFVNYSTHTYFRADTYREYTKNAFFVDYIDLSNAKEYWDVSEWDDQRVMAWVVENENSGYYDLYIGSNREIYARDLTAFFAEMTALENIEFDNLDTSLTTIMGNMFMDTKNLTSVDLSNFNTSNLTSMSSMFSGTGLINLDLSNFDFSNVTNMYYTFNHSKSLVSVNMSGLKANNVNNMQGTFNECTSLETLDLSGFEANSVVNMNSTFRKCEKLTFLDLSGIDTSNVTNMAGLFLYCPKLTTTLTVRNINTSYGDIFYGAGTATGASITVNYTSNTESLVDTIIAASNTHIIKGSLVN